jgi:hypothetical protein
MPRPRGHIGTSGPGRAGSARAERYAALYLSTMTTTSFDLESARISTVICTATQ